MNIFIFSDESGVFDKYHNDFFAFGGIVFIDKDSKDIACRKYIKAENDIRKSNGYNKSIELKASFLKNKHKRKLYRSLNNCYKFGVVVNLNQVYDRIFKSKKDKQRYQDYAYKIAVRRYMTFLIEEKIINKDDNINLHFFVDEHTTATNGKYDLRNGLEQELKNGQYNTDFSLWYPPVFNNVQGLDLNYCNSVNKTLIRAADIVANNIYHRATNGQTDEMRSSNGIYLYVDKLP